MKRREFLKSALAIAASSALPTNFYGQAPAEADPSVKRVLVLFMCHLDVGFTATQEAVLRQYFDQYYPNAISTAAKLRDEGLKDRYRWTTAAWLLYEHLEQASNAQRRQIESAVEKGDIEWHAMPFNWQTEALDRSTAAGCMGFSAALDRRFGRKTIGGKMSDVPGHSRGLVSVLSEHGVQLLDIGVNPGSTPPDVPEVFVWKNAKGQSVVMLYHHRAYGGMIHVPGSDLVIDMEIKVDNSGPHNTAEISDIYSTLRHRFPNAHITASSMSEIASAVAPFASAFPVITQEIGDTWIYGLPSDPVKMARYREMTRLRSEWMRSGHFSVGDRTDLQLLRRLALAPEHTWGTDTKRYIDHEHYPPAQLTKYLNTAGYKIMEQSWQEKRHNIDHGVAALPDGLRSEAMQRLAGLVATAPDVSGMNEVTAGDIIRGDHFHLRIDPATGCINGLTEVRSGQSWASPLNPLALFTYQTLTHADYERFLSAYVLSKDSWAPQDFGKPNIDRFPAESRSWTPKLQQLWQAKDSRGVEVVAKLAIHDLSAEEKGLVAWPNEMFLKLSLPNTEPIVEMTFVSLGKLANRMPEALWMTFTPPQAGLASWILDKVDEPVRADDVVRGGGRRMHAVTNHITCTHGDRKLQITTLDAPVVAMGTKSPLNYSPDLPDMADGVHFCLFNNAWGTNYIQWAGGDWMFRFRLSV